jgi:hypothetical protein
MDADGAPRSTAGLGKSTPIALQEIRSRWHKHDGSGSTGDKGSNGGEKGTYHSSEDDNEAFHNKL